MRLDSACRIIHRNEERASRGDLVLLCSSLLLAAICCAIHYVRQASEGPVPRSARGGRCPEPTVWEVVTSRTLSDCARSRGFWVAFCDDVGQQVPQPTVRRSSVTCPTDLNYDGRA